jgi:hypothetical protein
LALDRYAAQIDDQRRPIEGTVDWDAVALERQWFFVTEFRQLPAEHRIPSGNRSQTKALEQLINDNLIGMLSRWETCSHDTYCLNELQFVALIYAELGNVKALPLIEILHRDLPVEADLIRGILNWKLGKSHESSEILAAAIEQCRQFPWTSNALFDVALNAAVEISQTRPTEASRLLKAVSEPFSVFAADERRRFATCSIALNAAPQDAAHFFESFEPHVPWSMPFLALRAKAYAQSNHRLAAEAQRDVREFLRNP